MKTVNCEDPDVHSFDIRMLLFIGNFTQNSIKSIDNCWIDTSGKLFQIF